MKPDFSFTFHGWMMTELHLKGYELIAYMAIDSITQGRLTWFEASRSFMGKFLETSEKTAQRTLDSLVKKGYLKKKLGKTKTGKNVCLYQSVRPGNLTKL